MITQIAIEVDNALQNNHYVNSYISTKSEAEFEQLMNVDLVKSVGYMIKPTGMDVNGRFLSDLHLFIVDKANDDVNVLNATVDSSLSVIRDVFQSLSLSVSGVTISTDYVKNSENDAYTIVLTAVLKCVH